MRNPTDSRRLFILAALALVSIGGYGIHAASRSDDGPPPMRYRVDAARHRVWLLTPEGVVVDDASTRTTVTVPEWQWLLPPWGCLPDLALGPSGEAVITSNVLPTLWRIDPETLQVSVHPLAVDVDRDKDIGFSRIVYSPRDAAYFAIGSFDGAVWTVDPRLARARKLLAHERPAVALGQRVPGARAAACPLR